MKGGGWLCLLSLKTMVSAMVSATQLPSSQGNDSLGRECRVVVRLTPPKDEANKTYPVVNFPTLWHESKSHSVLGSGHHAPHLDSGEAVHPWLFPA